MTQPLQTNSSETLASLLLCTRTPVDADTSQQILALARSDPAWDGLLMAANEHSLMPLLCKNLETFAGEVLPGRWRLRFHEEFLRNGCRNLALSADLLRILEAFESHGVCATPYKGAVLAEQAYGDVALRQFSDLDVMVLQQHIAVAHTALLSLGYRALVPDLIRDREDSRRRQIPGQYAYRRDSATMVELHTERTLRYFPRRLDVDKLCERRELVKVAGRQVLTFSREDTLLLASVHGAKHFWERLGWIADIAGLAASSPPMDWAAVMERARKWGVQRMVLLGAGLAAALYEAPLPGCVSEILRRDATAQALIESICQRFVAEPAQRGIFNRFAFRVRMRGSLAEGVPYAVRLGLMPTELDRRRPAPYLEPVYALLRPFRLARAYGWRTRAGR